MKILFIGANGTIGKKVSAELKGRHEVITAGRNCGDIRVDVTSVESIKNLFKEVTNIDACICTTGTGHYGDFQTMTEENVYVGIKGKLMGQVNVVLTGQHYLNDGGSFTLVSGVLAEDPAKNSTNVAMVNGALNSFVLAAAQELKRGIRINVVSPGLVEDSFDRYGPLFPGFDPVPMTRVVNAFIKSVEGAITGKIIRVL